MWDSHLKCFTWKFSQVLVPNEHSTSNRRQFHVDNTWIRRRPNFDEFPRHFHVIFLCSFTDRKIHVVSTYFFRCNFDGRKIQFASMYFFGCDFDGWKIRGVSTYFFRCNFDGRKIHLVSTYIFDVISMVEKPTLLPRAFFDVISFIEISTVFLLTFFLRNFDGRIIHFVCTYFFRQIVH